MSINPRPTKEEVYEEMKKTHWSLLANLFATRAIVLSKYQGNSDLFKILSKIDNLISLSYYTFSVVNYSYPQYRQMYAQHFKAFKKQLQNLVNLTNKLREDQSDGLFDEIHKAFDEVDKTIKYTFKWLEEGIPPPLML